MRTARIYRRESGELLLLLAAGGASDDVLGEVLAPFERVVVLDYESGVELASGASLREARERLDELDREVDDALGELGRQARASASPEEMAGWPRLLHPGDPEADRAYHWPFCYLHGRAEQACESEADRNGWRAAPPDIFEATVPMPERPGSYPCTLYGQPAVAELRIHYGRLGGRVALLSDPEAMEQAADERTWA